MIRMIMRPGLVLACVIWMSCASPAFAYIGPGLGAGTIALVLGVVGSLFLALFAILWYPLKRLVKRRKNDPATKQASPEAD